jgi:hypothetical protein
MVDKFLLIDRTHGDRAPQKFAEIFDPVKWGIEAHDPDWICVKSGPESEFYAESWDAICDKAFLRDDTNNKTWYLHYDNGNIFGISYQMNDHTDLSDCVYFY